MEGLIAAATFGFSAYVGCWPEVQEVAMSVDGRSPWSRLRRADALALADALGAPEHLQRSPCEAAESVSASFARQSVTLLVGNDLRGALRAAEISVAASAIAQRYRSAEIPGEGEAVVGQDPASAPGTKSARLARSLHRPDRLTG